MEFKFSETLNECIIEGLRSVLGEGGVKAVLFSIEYGQHIDDPEEFHRYLFLIFGEGTLALEKVIVRKLFQRLNMPYEEKGDFSLSSSVEQARKLFAANLRRVEAKITNETKY